MTWIWTTLFIVSVITLIFIWTVDHSSYDYDYDKQYKILISLYPLSYIIITLLIYFTLN